MPSVRRSALLASAVLAGMAVREKQQNLAVRDPAARAQAVRRKVAVATWHAPVEGRLMTRLVVDADPLQAYVDDRRAAGAQGLTLMHVVGAAAARALHAVPAANARVLGSRIVPFDDVSVAFAVDIGQGSDLAPCKVAAADTLTPAEIATAVWAGVRQLRDGVHDGFNLTTQVASWVPGLLMRPLVMVSSLWLGGLAKPLLGQEGNPLGSVFISNVQPLGVEEVFLAPVPFARTPVYLSIGTVTERAVVRDGVVTAARQLTLCLTGDHRLVDGVQCAVYLDALQRLLREPEQLG